MESGTARRTGRTAAALLLGLLAFSGSTVSADDGPPKPPDPAPAAPPAKPPDPPAFDEDLPALWAADLSMPGLPSLPTVGTDSIVVNGGTIVCLDAATGAVRWRREDLTSDLVPEPPLWIDDPKEPSVAVTTGHGALVMLKASDGAERWRSGESIRLSQSPTRSGERLLIIDTSGAVSALDIATGKAAWTRAATEGQVLQPVTMDPRGALAFAVTGTWLYAIDPATGLDVWLVNLGVRPVSRPAIDGDSCFVLLADGKLMAFDADPRDGKDEGIADDKPEIIDRLWTSTVSAPWASLRDRDPRVTLALVSNTVLVSEESGTLHGVAQADGREVWRSAIAYSGGPHSPLTWRGHLLLSGTGSVTLVDSRNGARLARAMLPDLPSNQFLAVAGDRLIATERLIDARATALDLAPLVPFLPKE